MKKFIGRYWLTIIVSMIITAYAVRYAYRARGYFAVGGEWFILPTIILLRIELPGIIKFFKEVMYYGTTDDSAD